MKANESTADVNRRGFLKSLSGTAAGTAAAVTGVVSVTTSVEAAESKADRSKKRYRESEHVKTFYRTNRY